MNAIPMVSEIPSAWKTFCTFFALQVKSLAMPMYTTSINCGEANNNKPSKHYRRSESNVLRLPKSDCQSRNQTRISELPTPPKIFLGEICTFFG